VKDDPRFRAACAQSEALRLFGEKALTMDLFGPNAADAARFDDVGYLLLEKREVSANAAAQEAWRTTASRTRVAFVHDHHEISDAAEVLGETADLVVAFHYVADAQALRLEVSLRSRGSFDCCALAKMNGGGGHTRAAGFSVAGEAPGSRSPHAVVLDLVYAFESTAASG